MKKKEIWQKKLSKHINYNNTESLLKLTKLKNNPIQKKVIISKLFPLRAPSHFINNIEKGNSNDPLLKQILPIEKELKKNARYSKNPLKENEYNPVQGLLHKYHGRVLVMLTKACAIHCRYCFRRHFEYEKNIPSQTQWKKIITYIEKNNNIVEVVLSGGDPLSLSDELLISFCDKLIKIKHLKRLRIHTRIPIVFPERITSHFIQWVAQYPLKLIIVTHANHPNEMSSKVHKKLIALRNKKITLLNQSVLLRDVNDNADTLSLLSEKLFEAGVLPYYLHILDKTEGTAHFEVSLAKIKHIYAKLSSSLPGYLVPKLVREIPGKSSKTLSSHINEALFSKT